MQRSFLKLNNFFGDWFYVLVLFLCSCVAGEEGLDPNELDQWINYRTSDGIISNSITAFYEDSRGDLWIGTEAGIMRYREGTFEDFPAFSAVAGEITAITEDLVTGWILAGYGQGLGVYDGSWGIIDDIGIGPFGVLSLYTTSDQNVWIGTSQQQIAFLDETGFDFVTITGCPSCNTVYTFFEDTQGNLWFGTAGGAVVFDGSDLDFFNVSNEILRNNTVLSIAEDSFGKVWVGTFGGDEVHMMQLINSSLDVLYISLQNDVVNSVIRDIIPTRSGDMWLGAEAGGVIRYDGTIMRTIMDDQGPRLAGVITLIETSDGNIWVGTTDQGLYQYLTP